MRSGLDCAAGHVANAVAALKRARPAYPDKGNCAGRAIIEVEIQNLRATSRHLDALIASEHPDKPEAR